MGLYNWGPLTLVLVCVSFPFIYFFLNEQLRDSANLKLLLLLQV